MEDHAHLARLARALILVGVALLLSLAWASLAFADTPAFSAPSEVANQSGRLDTTSLYDLGSRTSALYAFSSNGFAFTQKLFWQSANAELPPLSISV